MGIVSLLQPEDLYPVPASQHAVETAHHSQYFCHRHVALRHECVCLLHRDFINNRLLNYGGDMAIGAFGILNRIQMLFVMIVMGITMGMQPITGYNYGAQHFDRVKRTLKLGITAGCIITTLGFIIGELFPGVFVGMFTDNHELTDEATLALRIGILSFRW